MKFTKEHEWVMVEGNIATVGITDHAAHQLGDIVSVDLPKAGASAQAGKEIAMIDSMKASSPMYAPVSGKVAEVNKALETEPQLINSSPHGDGWIMKIELSNPAEANGLMDEAQYRKFVEAAK